MGSELSLVQFNFTNFFAIVINHKPFMPIQTILIKIVESLIDSENVSEDSEDYKIWKENKAKVKWIYENTHLKVKKPLTTTEYMVYRNLQYSANKEIEIDDDTYKLIDLYRYLDEVVMELTKIVVSIGKKYSLEIPLNVYGSSQKSSQNAVI